MKKALDRARAKSDIHHDVWRGGDDAIARLGGGPGEATQKLNFTPVIAL